MSEDVTSDALVSQSDAQGRVLSGVGEMSDQLADRIEQRSKNKTPEDPPAAGLGTTADPPAADVPAATPPASRGRQRFADLTREREEARAETAKERTAREAAEKKAADLEARLASPSPEPAAPKPEPSKPAAEPKAKERFPPFEDVVARAIAAGQEPPTWDEYDDAKYAWRQQQGATETDAQMRQRIREEMDAERRTAEIDATIASTQERARKAYPDFDTHLKGPGGKVPMGRNAQESVERSLFIFQHPQSEHIQYAILKDPALGQKLQQSDPYTFGVLVAGLIPAEKPPRPAWTPPPAPAPMVGTSSPTTSTPSGELAKKGDFEGYREKRAAERGVKPRFR